jgi:hypothetical protein
VSAARACDAAGVRVVKGVIGGPKRTRRMTFGVFQMKRFLLAALLLLLSAGGAWAQDPEQRIQAARRRAESTGIPVALLDSKVAEGRAKNVPMERIAAAVERRLQSLGAARDAMGGRRVAAADLAVGADALEAGVSPQVLGRLATTAPAQHRAVAIAVLTQLVQDGLASERALERVTAALARGPEALRSLPGERRGGGVQRGGGPPPGRGPPDARGQGRGRGQGGGPPSSVPGPKEKPNKPNRP